MLSTDIGVDNSFKAYMDYRTITDTSSKQWNLQETAYTDPGGFRRSFDDSYMVALGTYYTQGEVGQEYLITFEDGQTITCVCADTKNDEHTDPSNRYTPVTQDLGCIVEFIVDVDALDDKTKQAGDCSTVFKGSVLSIVSK